MSSSNTRPVVVFDRSFHRADGEYLALVEYLGGDVERTGHGAGRINPLDGQPFRAERVEQLMAGMARAQAQESLWSRTADGADRVATHSALVWAMARIELAGDVCSTTAIQKYLPRTSWAEGASTGEGLA